MQKDVKRIVNELEDAYNEKSREKKILSRSIATKEKDREGLEREIANFTDK